MGNICYFFTRGCPSTNFSTENGGTNTTYEIIENETTNIEQVEIPFCLFFWSHQNRVK